jgi:ribosomal protein S18 acetylase RimI-like enzyme
MIRKAVAADVPFVTQCARAAFARYVADIGREPAPMAADYATLIASGAVYLAQDPQDRAVAAPVGFIAFYPDGAQMVLDAIAVLPGGTGQGIGRRLIAFCEAAARQQGLSSVRLVTNAKMTANLSIYPHLGYQEVDRRLEDGFDRVFFEKQLTT